MRAHFQVQRKPSSPCNRSGGRNAGTVWGLFYAIISERLYLQKPSYWGLGFSIGIWRGHIQSLATPNLDEVGDAAAWWKWGPGLREAGGGDQAGLQARCIQPTG